MIPRATGFIFDLDGTLIYFPVDWAGLRKQLKSTANLSYEFQPIFQVLRKVSSEMPELKGPLFRKIDEFELQAAPRARLYEGAAEVLEILRKSSDVMSLVTMQGRTVTDYLFENLNLKNYFSSSFTREISLDRADQLELALKEMGVNRKDAVFVGDKVDDLNAAKQVGVGFIPVRGRMDVVDPAINNYPSMSALLEALRSSGERVKVLR